jgi:ferric-dicitrate binding protein FerR (iron transport regulator)/TolA-binding protein
MTSCRRMRAAIIAVVRRQATEAERLCLEKHLTTCRSCRADKARWLLIERLEQPDPPRLSQDARARILGHLTDLPDPEVVVERKARRLLPALTGGTLAVAIAVALLVVLPGDHRGAVERAASGGDHESQPASPAPGRAIAIQAKTAGTLDAGRAHIQYEAGAALRVQPGGREVELFAGEIDVEVTPGGPRFRVLTPRFTVEVLGTRFIVRLDRVRTVHGVVRVAEPDAAGARQLALVGAGQTWICPDSSASAGLASATTHGPGPTTRPSASLPPSATLRAQGQGESLPAAALADNEGSPTMEQTQAGIAPPSASGVAEGSARPSERTPVARREVLAGSRVRSVDELLSDARAALAAGNTDHARDCVTSALRARPKPRQRAMAELLSADTMLVESRYDDALTAYRGMMDRFASYPEGETAAFALAQLLSERGPQDRAQQALERYLARYPTGRFAAEVKKKLANATPR